MTSPPDPSPDITGALALLREALRAPVPPKPIIEFALDACAAAGFPPTTPELDDKLRALGMLFGKAAPSSAELTHFLWHLLDGNIPLSLTRQALDSLDKLEFKGLAGEQTRKVLEVVGADLGAVYGDSLVKNLAVLLRAMARRAVELTTAEWSEACHVAREEKIAAVKALAAAGGSNLEGELAAARSEAAGLRQTQALLEADLTLICETMGLTTAKDVAGSIKEQHEALAIVRRAYNVAMGRHHDLCATAEEVAEHIRAVTRSNKALQEHIDQRDEELTAVSAAIGARVQERNEARGKVAELRAEVENLQGLLKADAETGEGVAALKRERDELRGWGRARHAALQSLGWDGKGDPREWVKNTDGVAARDNATLGDQIEEAVVWCTNNAGRGLAAELAQEAANALRAKLIAMPAVGQLTWAIAQALHIGAETAIAWADGEQRRRSGPVSPEAVAFIERGHALLVKPLRDELRSRQAPNLAAFGYEKAEPQRIVELAAERIQVDAREIGRLRAANRDLTAKIESAPGSGLRKRLKEAERIAGNPGEIGARQVELEKMHEAVRKAKQERDAVLAAARKDPTGASILKDMEAELEQYRKDCVAAEHAHDAIKAKYQALAAAVCPFPKPHDKLVKQASDARDRAVNECAKGLPPEGYRLEEALAVDGVTSGWRWARGSERECNYQCGLVAMSPGFAVLSAWLRREEEARVRVGGDPEIAAKMGLTITPQGPLEQAYRALANAIAPDLVTNKFPVFLPAADVHEALLGKARALVKERATLIGDLQDIALEVDPSLGGEALLERIRQIVHDGAKHIWSTGAKPRCRRCDASVNEDAAGEPCPGSARDTGPQPGPDPHGSTKPSPVQDTRVGADEADMQRIRDLLHERRVRLAVRDGEACSWPELVRGLVDDFYTAEGDEKYLRRRIEELGQKATAAAAKVEHLEAQLKLAVAHDPRLAELDAAWAKTGYAQPLTAESLKYIAMPAPARGSAADHMRSGWDGGAVVSKFGGQGQQIGYPPPMEHPGVLALTINTPDAFAGAGAQPSLALWYRLGDKTWCLAQQQIEPMRWGDTFLLTIPLGPT